MFKIFRKLDDNWDWTFGKGIQNYGDNKISAMQNIKSRLLSVKYDCFFDLTSGVDWFNILSQRGQFAKDVVEINIRLCILQSLYVTEITDLQITYNQDRSITAQYTVNTIFGEIEDTTVIGGQNA